MADKKPMPELQLVVESYKDQHGSNDSKISERMGLERGTLWSWWNRGLENMPSPFALHRLSVAIHTPYRDVLDAALKDFGYLPEAAAAEAEAPARMKKGTGRKVK